MSSARDNLLATFDRLYPQPVEKPAAKRPYIGDVEDPSQNLRARQEFVNSFKEFWSGQFMEKYEKEVYGAWAKASSEFNNNTDDLTKKRKSYMEEKDFFTKSFSYPYDD